ncbi:hypothetical protein MM440_12630 [Arsenicicoccus piscis]|nr:hypothetical protein [Arsenicicoccus piscis]MCH8628582.1 hypothetical protein [Arsenicicoccus piscis]
MDLDEHDGRALGRDAEALEHRRVLSSASVESMPLCTTLTRSGSTEG